jgi:Sigma-70 region 2
VPDTEGFEEFYLVTVGRLVGVLFPVTGDLHEAEEIAQEAYARASVRWARLRDYDAPEAWVRRVAMNLAADRGRRLQRQARALLRADPVPDEVAAQLWEDTKTALRACGVGKAAGPRLIAQGTAYGRAWVLGARPPRSGKGMCWSNGEAGPGGGSEVATSGSAGSPSREIVAGGSSGDSHGSVWGHVTERATLVRVLFNDGRKPLETTPVRAGPRFPVDFYIVYFPQQGSPGGWRVAQVLALDRDGRVIASCRTRDTCSES